MNTIDISQAKEIFTVTRLNREARFLLENHFSMLWVEGEISNFSAPNSGHWYFSLKDQNAQIRCCMFKPHNRKIMSIPTDGMHVMIKARVSLYEGRGDFQLLVEHLEDAGIGKLQKEFEKLKKKLSDAGLFDPAHKKALPLIPKSIAIISSPSGAAVHDILHILKRRFCAATIIIYPTLVQGEAAAANIINAIETANKRKECDVIILARGGGSIEDLWSFNDEQVAYAIFNSQLPIISGIGHEIDFTIADFVADLRAPTPSAAAELITPNSHELLFSLAKINAQFVRHMTQSILHLKQNLQWLLKQVNQQHPQRKLLEKAQSLDLYEATLIRLQLKCIQDKKTALITYVAKLHSLSPRFAIQEHSQKLIFQKHQLENRMVHQLQNYQERLIGLAAKLEALSPLATLKRGFTIATQANGALLHSIKNVKVGDAIQLQMIDGQVDCIVTGQTKSKN